MKRSKLYGSAHRSKPHKIHKQRTHEQLFWFECICFRQTAITSCHTDAYRTHTHIHRSEGTGTSITHFLCVCEQAFSPRVVCVYVCVCMLDKVAWKYTQPHIERLLVSAAPIVSSPAKVKIGREWRVKKNPVVLCSHSRFKHFYDSRVVVDIHRSLTLESVAIPAHIVHCTIWQSFGTHDYT